MGLQPQRTRCWEWVDSGHLPPSNLVSTMMEFAMMAST
jgi:hypothetical protein